MRAQSSRIVPTFVQIGLEYDETDSTIIWWDSEETADPDNAFYTSLASDPEDRTLLTGSAVTDRNLQLPATYTPPDVDERADLLGKFIQAQPVPVLP